MPRLLHSPARHAPLAGEPWTDARARAHLQTILGHLEADYGGEERLWPNHPADLEGDPDAPFRTVYLGAAGIVYALRRLPKTATPRPRSTSLRSPPGCTS